MPDMENSSWCKIKQGIQKQHKGSYARPYQDTGKISPEDTV